VETQTCPYVIDSTGQDVQAEGARLRALGPAVRVELPGGVLAWSINSYALARQVFAGGQVAKDPRKRWPAFINGEIAADWPLISWVMMDSMAIADDADHRRLRGLIGGQFSPRRMEARRPLIERAVASLLDELARTPPGDIVDLRTEFTYPLASQVICEMLGVPVADRAGVLRGGRVAVTTTLTPEAAEANLRNWQQALHDLVESKRERPGDDLISELVQAQREDAARLSDSELVGSLFQLFGAGSEPMMNLLSNAVVALLTHPDQLTLAKAGQASWADVIEETLRAEAPLAQLPLRFALADIELDGVTISKGDAIVICLAAAGRDHDRHGPTADLFDVSRADKEHLSLGHGAHFCLGAPLARLEASVALPALFDRFPELTLAISPEELRPEETFIMNGPLSLPVYLGPPRS
jgi:cytochrome P450